MERYHTTAGEPPRRDNEAKAAASALLADQVEAFLARGGRVQEIGHQMRETPEPFVINVRTTPVYNDNGGTR
ncbi:MULTISPECIES: hypothetical protein [unclassified Pseudomonas]|uniref:hypothetical protein n=1 Tax=unclassified Pseudomonas TaxID=196821 RepID=UPI002449EBE8|nr:MULTISPECIES: hypothetical protein [unclassified Pseudomonas]MDH0894394.1 hypothetical protein [Pseudomonas sp. GD03875]MDH1063311.1 hypothetical protein [Pseudomonas sp. GD03985]